MAIFTRIVATAALVSLALTPIASASPEENYGLAHQRARSAHGRAARVNAIPGGERKKRAVAKRCNAPTTSLSSAHPETTSAHSSAPITTAEQKPVTTSAIHTTTTEHTTTKAVTTTSKAPATTSKAPANVGGGSSGSGSKKGLAWSGSTGQLSQYTSKGNIGFIYNWGASPPIVDGIMGCSMLWGEKNLDDFRSNRDKYSCLMGPNEFNLGAQSGLSVSQVYSLWQNEVLPYAAGKFLIAPSVTTAPDGLTDMQELVKMCGGDCKWDCLSVHFYGTTAADLISWTTTFYNSMGNTPICLTEFSCQSFSGGAACSSSDASAFLQGVVQWAESTEWIKYYSPYGFAEDLGNVAEVNALMSSEGDITSLGNWYIGN